MQLKREYFPLKSWWRKKRLKTGFRTHKLDNIAVGLLSHKMAARHFEICSLFHEKAFIMLVV